MTEKLLSDGPDVQGRLEILNVHAAKKPLGDDVDLESLARTTAGFTGADLENLLNEAAINAAKRKEKYITNADVNYAFVKVGIGVENAVRLFLKKKRRLRHTTNPDMQFYFICFRMSVRCIRFPLFRREWGSRLYYAVAGTR